MKKKKNLLHYKAQSEGIQSTPDNSNLQGKSKKSSSYRELEENSQE